MVGITRIHAVRQNNLRIVHIAKAQAEALKQQLKAKGFVVEHVEQLESGQHSTQESQAAHVRGITTDSRR